MHDRFYLPVSYSQEQVVMEGSQTHHLLHVLRKQPGDSVELFDGAGNVAEAEVLQTGKKQVTLKILSCKNDPPASSPCITLATAVPKGERFRWLVEKATELNVSRIIPLRTSRSVVHPQAGKMQKMEQTVIAACKQSGRNRLLEIDILTSWEDLLQRDSTSIKFIVADPSGTPLQVEQQSHLPEEIVLCVGPEGGLSAVELELAKQTGAEIVSLGDQILRIETTALVLAAFYRDT